MLVIRRVLFIPVPRERRATFLADEGWPWVTLSVALVRPADTNSKTHAAVR
jgi:hypothetical protein